MARCSWGWFLAVLWLGLASSAWAELSTLTTVGSGPILDFDARRVLYLNAAGDLVLRTLPDSRDEVLFPALGARVKGRLTPEGAVFARLAERWGQDELHVWQAGTVTPLGLGTLWEARGPYAVYSRGEALVLRHLPSGTESPLPGKLTGLTLNEVALTEAGIVYICEAGASTGVYDYESLPGTLFRVERGVVQTWRAPGQCPTGDTAMATDGSLLVHPYNGQFKNERWVRYGLALGGPEATARLQAKEVGDPRVAGGWVAWSGPPEGTQEGRQVWRRDPQGQVEQVTSSSAPSELEALAPDGQLLFTREGRRYLSKPGAASVEVSEALGSARWGEGRWLVVAEQSLLELSPPPSAPGEQGSGCGAASGHVGWVPWLGLVLVAVLGRSPRRNARSH